MLNMLFKKFSARVADFKRDEKASLSIEALIIVPAIVLSVTTLFTVYDYFRARNVSLQANYAISDLLSRETNPVDADYLDGLHDLFAVLAPTGDSTWLRVSVIECVSSCQNDSRNMRTYWSYMSGNGDALTTDDINDTYNETIPVFASGEYVILVETNVGYTSPFTNDWSGIGNRNLGNTVVTRPRFAPKLDWESS